MKVPGYGHWSDNGLWTSLNARDQVARWGRVRSDGVSLPIRLTRNVLADLAAARRPTVTSALTELAKQGLVRPDEPGWLLQGSPPGELLELEAVPPRLTAESSRVTGQTAR
jgi:Crp-like helix-turn-helix domain